MRLLTKDYHWYKYLNDAVFNYNHGVHSTTHHKPIEIWKGEKPNEQDIEQIQHKLIPGDKVKIITKKNIFEKGDSIKASKETYVVEQVKQNKIKLFGNDHWYKPHELSIVYELDSDDEIDYDVLKPSEEAKEHKKELLHKSIGINESNIIEGKRKRKPNPKFSS